MPTFARTLAVAALATFIAPSFAEARPAAPKKPAPIVRQGARANVDAIPSAEVKKPGLLERAKTYFKTLGAELKNKAATGAAIAAELAKQWKADAKASFAAKLETLTFVWGKLNDAGEAALGYLKAAADGIKKAGKAALAWCGLGPDAAAAAAADKAEAARYAAFQKENPMPIDLVFIEGALTCGKEFTRGFLCSLPQMIDTVYSGLKKAKTGIARFGAFVWEKLKTLTADDPETKNVETCEKKAGGGLSGFTTCTLVPFLKGALDMAVDLKVTLPVVAAKAAAAAGQALGKAAAAAGKAVKEGAKAAAAAVKLAAKKISAAASQCIANMGKWGFTKMLFKKAGLALCRVGGKLAFGLAATAATAGLGSKAVMAQWIKDTMQGAKITWKAVKGVKEYYNLLADSACAGTEPPAELLPSGADVRVGR